MREFALACSYSSATELLLKCEPSQISRMLDPWLLKLMLHAFNVGTLIRRHRIHKPAPEDDLFYTVEDFNVGKQIIMHGRPFQITVRLLYITFSTVYVAMGLQSTIMRGGGGTQIQKG